MEDFWARFIESSGQPGPNYWEYYAKRLAQLASIPKDAAILDLGTYDGNVLFKAIKKMSAQGYAVGADIDYEGFHDGVQEIIQRGWGKKLHSFKWMRKHLVFFLRHSITCYRTLLAGMIALTLSAWNS